MYLSIISMEWGKTIYVTSNNEVYITIVSRWEIRIVELSGSYIPEHNSNTKCRISLNCLSEWTWTLGDYYGEGVLLPRTGAWIRIQDKSWMLVSPPVLFVCTSLFKGLSLSASPGVHNTEKSKWTWASRDSEV